MGLGGAAPGSANRCSWAWMTAGLARGASGAAPGGVCMRSSARMRAIWPPGEAISLPFVGRATRVPEGGRDRGSFRSVRGPGVICVAQDVTILMFHATPIPPRAGIVRKLPRSRSKARASPIFEERAASRDQRRLFSHHMQPQALETPLGTPQGAVTLAPRTRIAAIRAENHLRIRHLARPPTPTGQARCHLGRGSPAIEFADPCPPMRTRAGAGGPLAFPLFAILTYRLSRDRQ